MALALTIDFGSTFTKGGLFDLAEARLLGVAYEPSTVESDVTIGLGAVLARLQPCSPEPIAGIPARVCSSAAGGLRMVVIGLVPSLSLEAAQRAALGAGAKIVGAHGHKLTNSALQAIAAARPDLVLLAGGIDGGDEETIVHNARAFSGLGVPAPVIVAGNVCVADECASIVRAAGSRVLVCRNILPEVDRIEVDEVHRAIRDLFVEHITRAKGIERVSSELNLTGPIVPTPSAVLQGCRLLAEGAPSLPGLGDLAAVDIGGATTDVHTATAGTPTRPGVIRRGLPELYLKRTVEGDLGIRVNAPTIVQRVGAEHISHLAAGLKDPGPAPEDVSRYAAQVAADPSRVPDDDRDAALDAALARSAVELAIRRHAGSIKEVYTASGRAILQYGKDLGAVSTVVGIGGVIAFGRHAGFALAGALAGPDAPFALLPARPRFLLDRSYVLYAAGLLAEAEPRAAFQIATRSLIPAENAAAPALGDSALRAVADCSERALGG